MAKNGYVLLVDDDRDALFLLLTLLGRNNYRTLTASNGDEAIDIIKARAPEIDAIVLDLMMPGHMDGYGVCKWINDSSDSDIRDIPVVVVSARSSPQDMVKSFASGAFQHISKPYDVQYLIAVIESTVRMKRLQDEARNAADKFETIFEHSPLGVGVVDRDFNILEMNRVLRERYPSVTPGSGIKFYEFFYSTENAEKPNENSPLYKALESGTIKREQINVVRNEVSVWWDMIASPLRDKNGRITGAVVILDDVTHERVVEEQLVSEIRHSRKAEERLREVLRHQDKIAENLMHTQKELRQKQEQLTEAYQQLEQANEKLEHISVTDELTGLYNRRHFDNTFEMEIRRAKRYTHNLSIMMIDIDHFKNINDTHGHQIGDFVLSRLAKILQGELRETDILSRYGGEEFVVVLPETSEEMAMRIASRTREAVEEAEFKCSDDLVLKVTISVGIKTGHNADLSTDKMLADADAALYRAKDSGRNQVVQCESD